MEKEEYNSGEINIRIAKMIEDAGLTINSFAKEINETQQNLNKILKPKTTKWPGVSPRIRSKICKYFNITLQELEFGKPLLNCSVLPNQTSDIPVISFTSGVPYFNVDFVGGFDLVLNDQTTKPEYLIDFKKYNNASCWCNITGRSMEPEISHGDIIALREISDPSFLPFGEIYAIVTTNGLRTVKKLAKGSSQDTYTLIPANKSPEYSAQEIPRNMILKIYQVLGCMKKL